MANVGTAPLGRTLIGTGVTSQAAFAAIGTDSGLTDGGVVISKNLGAFEATSAGTAGQVLTSNGAGVNPTFQAAGGGTIPWSDRSTSGLISANNGYFVTATVTLLMPIGPQQGDKVYMVSAFAGAVTMQGNTGQAIRIGTATGTACTSANIGDSIEFVYRSTNATWWCVGGPEGTFNVT